MAYDEFLADRIRQNLNEKKTNFSEKKMMGGLMFSVNDKMLCGIHIDKKINQSLLMARIGESAHKEASKNENVLPMDFTGRPMKGYIFIKPEGFETENNLNHWLDLCLDFNPIAKSSKKRKKRKQT